MPSWTRSPHTSKMDPELNDACRSITGCLRPTNVEELYLLAGIAPPNSRRGVCARVETKKQETTQLTLYMARFQQTDACRKNASLAPYDLMTPCKSHPLQLLFAMIRSVVKSFKVPGVEVVASLMSNEAALTRMIDSTPKKKLGHT